MCWFCKYSAGFWIVLEQFVAFENETFHFVIVQMVNSKGFLSVFFLWQDTADGIGYSCGGVFLFKIDRRDSCSV